MSDEELAELDELRRAESGPIPSRSDMLRLLIKRALAEARSAKPSKKKD
jgi:hypothetical protein